MSDVFILIVDDKPKNLFALEAILKEVPAVVVCASSGDEALALTLQYDFALAILDVQMPDMDGYELASYLLDDPNTSRIPIIFLSAAYSDEHHTFKGYEKGAVDYIIKPFEPTVLLSKVRVFLELARYRIQLEQLVHDRTVAFQDEERKLRSIMESTPDSIFNIDHLGRIIFLNAPEKYSYLIGSSIFDLLLNTDIDLQKNALDSVFKYQENTSFESYLNLPWYSNYVPCSIRLSPIINDQKVVSCLQIARDISDSKLVELSRLEKLQAEAENKAKSKFLASMSHEIRTPMNAILGYTQLLKRDKTLSDNQFNYLDIIENSGEHLLALIDSVLDMARIESGRMILSPSKINITKIICDITRMFQLTANKQGIELTISQSDDTPTWIFADANKIRQIVINLVGNALKFTQQGMIQIRTGLSELTDDQIRFFIDVQDSGCGIGQDQIDSIFLPFVQADVGNSNVGVGLGLAVSKEIARLMSGSLSVQSEVGKGSTFRFEFPALVVGEQLVKSVTPVQWEVTDENLTKILVVDDDLDNLNMIGNILVSVGLTVSLANSGEEALDIFTEYNPGLVILDYHMEPVSGLEVAKNIRRLKDRADIPIIMISASPFEENIEQSIQAGANVFLAKPFREEEFFTAIQQVSCIKFNVDKNKINSSDTLFRENNLIHDLSNVTNFLKVGLYNAIQTGYIDEISHAIELIENESSSIGSALRALADIYQYSKILSLLNDKEVSNAQ